MILKIVLPILVLWIFEYYDGVLCKDIEPTKTAPSTPIEERKARNFEIKRQYDIFKYLNYGIEDFDEHNRHCYLAFLVYLSKKMFHDKLEQQLTKNINILETFSKNVNRVLSTEFTIKFDNKTSKLHDKIHNWFATLQSDHVKTVVDEANGIIKLGLDKYIWKTEKEFEIIRIYRNDTNTDAELQMIQKAYEVCKNNYFSLANPTYTIGIYVSNVSRHQDHFWNYYNFVPTEFKDFGSLILFLTDDEYWALRNDNDNQSRNLYIVQFLEKVLIEIIRQINAVLQQMKDMTGMEPDVCEMELLFILRHLYLEATNTTQDLYLLFRILAQKTEILKEYILFSVSFKKKWTTIFSQTKSIVKPSKSIKKKTVRFVLPRKEDETQKIKHPVIHLNERKSFKDEEAYDPTEDLESVDLQNVNQGRFSQRKPSFIRLYSVFNDSWYDPIPNESNLNEKKVLLYELNAMLVVVKHHIYSLTVAARSKQKKNPAWDCGFINGISAPQTGPLGYTVDTYPYIKPDKFNTSLMNELKSARKFIMEYRSPILQENTASTE